MTETAAYIRDSIKEMYPPGEVQALVRLIMERVCGLSTYQLLLGKGNELSDTEKTKIEEIVRGLRSYRPIQYLLGVADFCGMAFKVTPDVLIPRPETAELVGRIVADYRGQSPRILDIGTGSGCIAISLARHLPEAEIAAMDISAKALAVADENARRLGARVSLFQGDILAYDSDRPRATSLPSPAEGKTFPRRGEDFPTPKENFSHDEWKEWDYNCLVSNPPYIMERERATLETNVLENEPHLALFVPDEDPLLFYRAIARFGQSHLAEGGRLYLEINALCGKETVAMLRREHYKEVELIQDLYGKDRIVKASI